MGQNESSFKRTYEETLSELSSVQLGEITSKFNELYSRVGGPKGLVVDREGFSKYLNLPVAVGDRLFDAFDRKKNGSICFEEFVCGLAIVLHGSFKERCGLLFSVFNLGNDEGISREELRTMLTAIYQSTNTILYTVGDTDRAVLGSEDMQDSITAMVDVAFANCDITRTGKLLPLEFEYWLKQNPKILDTLLSFNTKKEECTIGSLIMSPSEQKLDKTSSSSSSQLGHMTKPPQQQKRRSPFSLRRGSKNKNKDKEKDSPAISNPPRPSSPKIFQVGGEREESLSSSQGSLNSDLLQSVVIDSLVQYSDQDITKESGQDDITKESGEDLNQDVTKKSGEDLNQDVAKESGSGQDLNQDITKESGEDDVSVKAGQGVNQAITMGSGQGTSQGVLGQTIGQKTSIEDASISEQSNLQIGIIDSQDKSKSYGEGVDGNVSQVSLQIDLKDPQDDVMITAGTESHAEDTMAAVGLPDQEIDSTKSLSVALTLDNPEEAELGSVNQTDKKPVQEKETICQQVGLDLENAIDKVQTDTTTPSSSLDPKQTTDEDPGILNHAESAVTGSIMHPADSGLSIDLSRVTQVQAEDEPSLFSPVLPTTQTLDDGERLELMGPLLVGTTGPAKEEEEEKKEDKEEEEEKEEEGMVKLIEEVAVKKELPKIKSPAVDKTETTPPPSLLQFNLPTSAPADISPGVQSGSVSPFLEQTEGSKVNEDLYQAWILSSWTKTLLENPQPGTHLTCPSLMTDIILVDGIDELLAANYPDRPRKTLLTVEHVSMDAVGLRRLVLCGSLHAALELTARFLSAHGQGLGQLGQPTIHTHKTLQMWSARIALMMHLKLYKEAELELQAFGEMLNPDLYYQYHTQSYPGKKGSLIPFSLRLLHATLPRHVGKSQLSLDRLCTLQYICEQILAELALGRLPGMAEPLSKLDQEVAESIWKGRVVRVKCCLANTLITMQDYGLAVKLYEELVEDQPDYRTEILSGIGRLYLQLGDLRTAMSYFERVQLEMSPSENNPLIKLNEGYVNVFLSRWQTARDCFEAALTLDPTNVVIRNNITVCTFYMGHLKEAIISMENIIISDPPASLQPSLLANLATSYELESGNSMRKKLSFVPLLALHVGQGYQHLSQLNVK